MSPGATDQQIPGPLLLQAASASLAVLRNNKGISPVVKLQLRQAAHDLKEASAAVFQGASVEKAAEALRACLGMIQSGMTIESDERLLPGIASVLGYLTQFLGGPPAPVVERLQCRPTTTPPLPMSVEPAKPAGSWSATGEVDMPPRSDSARDFAVPAGARPVAATVVLPGMGSETPQPMVSPRVQATIALEAAAPAFATAPPAERPSPRPNPAPERKPPPPPKPPPVIPLENLSPTLSLQLVRIERQYVARAGCIDDPNSTLADLQAIERRIRKREATARDLLVTETGTREADAGNEITSIGAWWFWGQTGRLVAGNPLLAATARSLAAGPAEEHRIAIDVVRMNPTHASATDIWGALRGPALMPLRARCLPLLFENNLPDGEALVRMLDEPTMAMAAASALAWCRIDGGSRRLLEKARACQWPELSDALLLASVAQGDREPLSEVRIRLATGSDSRWLVDALAVAGDEADASLLLDVASGDDASSEYALWALSHLGASSALANMKDLEARLEPVLVERAIELVAGSCDLGDLAPGRYVDGEPWSVSALARRLEAPAELPLPLLRWSALDLAIRTGEAAPCIYDIGASTEQQHIAGRAFVACYTATLEPGRGGWYYFGRPVGSHA